MHLRWLVDDWDRRAVESIVEQTKTDEFVLRRKRQNVDGPAPTFDRETAWKVLVGCLLTTQQRSGPDSPISRFLRQDPFPLRWGVCSQPDVQEWASEVLSSFGGIRRWGKVADEIARNAAELEHGGWRVIEDEFEALREQRARAPRPDDAALERAAANRIDDLLIGFGPKQARNLWQWLGLTRYEVPIDSRITKWLSTIAFPLDLNASVLANRECYELVLDGVRALCRECDVLPCVLDAAVFGSFDAPAPDEPT